jgi:riboflavin kinase
MPSDKPREPVASPDSGPEAPYPVRLSGPVIKGFGRGSKDVRFWLLMFTLLV